MVLLPANKEDNTHLQTRMVEYNLTCSSDRGWLVVLIGENISWDGVCNYLCAGLLTANTTPHNSRLDGN
jgi:hypothetical protein